MYFTPTLNFVLNFSQTWYLIHDKSIRSLLILCFIVLQKFREIKECLETSAFLFLENFVKSKNTFKKPLFLLFCKNFVNTRILSSFSSCFSVVLQKLREITLHRKFILFNFSQIFLKATLLKIVWNQKMLWIFFLHLQKFCEIKNWITYSDSCNFAVKRLRKYKCDFVCKKLSIGVLY